jgi:asparagine synthase (glutamine-hydrolysing)
MSVQFGNCHLEGKPLDPRRLESVAGLLEPYGPDTEGRYCASSVVVLHRGFHTTEQSLREVQPYVAPSGFVLAWDGRLDNRDDLLRDLRLAPKTTDAEIVGAAYDAWGTSAFSKVVGDWAVSIWDDADRCLILAKDFLGTRHLYYSMEKDEVAWCTVLEPLLQVASRRLRLEEEYIAGWLSFFPAPHLTPYVGIHAVPPSCFVRLAKGTHTITKYWDFDPGKRISYRLDREYEEHFRNVFSRSIERRLSSQSPILAELSGGIDSSSIVCVADTITAKSEKPSVHTVSYFNDDEPNWDEKRYFAAVERSRGQTGFHIDAAQADHPDFIETVRRFASFPASLRYSHRLDDQLSDCMNSHGSRVVLSGFGGDEVMGGVPTPVPELADLLARGKFRVLLRQLNSWALAQRRPWLHLLFDALREFLPAGLTGNREDRSLATWLNTDFAEKHASALGGYESRVTMFGALPSFQENVAALNLLRRQLSCVPLSSVPLKEERYPFLDRDLLEFLFALPREQLVRPWQRRSLMRRALAGIVPDEILNRKRKGFLTRAHLAAIRSEWSALVAMGLPMLADQLGIVDTAAFSECVQKARTGGNVALFAVKRTLALEFWLRSLRFSGRIPELDREATAAVSDHALTLGLVEKRSAS